MSVSDTNLSSCFNFSNKSPYIIIDNIQDIKLNISISHDGDYAIAFAIIEK